MTSIKTLLGMMFNPDHEQHTTLTQCLSLAFLGATAYVVFMGALGMILSVLRG